MRDFFRRDAPNFVRFMRLVDPNLEAPGPYLPVLDALVAMPEAPLRLVVRKPPRFGGTTLLRYLMAWVRGHAPEALLAYHSCHPSAVRLHLHQTWDVCTRLGVQASRQSPPSNLFAGLVGEAVEARCRLLVVDSLFKGWAEACSLTQQQRLQRWFSQPTPGGPVGVLHALPPEASILVVLESRHEGDVADFLCARGFRYLNLPATDDEGRVHTSCWPRLWTAQELEEVRGKLPPHEWASRYLGVPARLGQE